MKVCYCEIFNNARNKNEGISHHVRDDHRHIHKMFVGPHNSDNPYKSPDQEEKRNEQGNVGESAENRQAF